MTNANLAGAVVTGASFESTTSQGFTQAQLASTASYQTKSLQGIVVANNNLTGWDFSGQNHMSADLNNSTLTNEYDRYGKVINPASWSEGDWNADAEFNSTDLMTALADGGYEQGLRPPAAAAVPEPEACALFTIGLVVALSVRRTRRVI